MAEVELGITQPQAQPHKEPRERVRVPEILAPAGGRAQFFAALNAGADAVYLGLKDFNARSRAENFTVADLRELVPLAKRFGMKVLVTTNILIKDLELPRLVDTLGALEELGVDAIIVQDLGLARLAKAHFPHLRLHASTQMAIHNLAGVMEAWHLGFKRVVLARELTAVELKRIRAALPADTVELEAFCHGSLCYSYSGLCFFSGANDARSGNRGECAYTCRKPYKIINEPGHGFLFSMRDLDTSHALETLVAAGVDTLKIEGRKKDAQYVAAVVKLYRKKLDDLFGRSTLRDLAPDTARLLSSESEIRSDLALSFQRQPTSFFVKGRYHENVIDLDNPSHLGLRVGDIVSVQGRTIRLKTECELERFDGLRARGDAKIFHASPQDGATALTGSVEALQTRYANADCQFSLRQLKIGNRPVFFAARGSVVDIEVPDDCRMPHPGDVLFKVRSADLKRRVQKLETAPPDSRLKSLSFVDVALSLRMDIPDHLDPAVTLCLQATVSKCATPIVEARVYLPRELARQESDLAKDVSAIFSLFGDQGFAAQSLVLDTSHGDDANWFVPRAKLKELKNLIGAQLSEAYATFVAQRTANAHAALREERKPKEADLETSYARFAVKLDRLETLAHLQEFVAAHRDFPLAEVVFEPKKAFLPSLKPAELVETLLAFTRETGAPVRLALPPVVRAWDEPLLKLWLSGAAQRGMRRYEIANLGGFSLLSAWGLGRDNNPHACYATDFTLYALNEQASRVWAEAGASMVTLSVEDDLENLRSHLRHWPWDCGVKPQVILYKDTPLFIAEACSLTALHNGCPTAKVCGYRTLEIENQEGERFFVAHENCKSIVYAKQAYAITQAQREFYELGVRDFRVDFLTRPYAKDAMEQVLFAAWRSQSCPETHTANYERKLL